MIYKVETYMDDEALRPDGQKGLSIAVLTPQTDDEDAKPIYRGTAVVMAHANGMSFPHQIPSEVPADSLEEAFKNHNEAAAKASEEFLRQQEEDNRIIVPPNSSKKRAMPFQPPKKF